MAWNEPGGKDRDPWNSPGGNQGPPDLDEAFRNLQRRLSSMFGGGARGTGKVPAAAGGNLFGLLALAAVLLYFGLGIYTVDQQERGVVLRFGKALDEEVLPGLHWNAPLIDVPMIVNVTRLRSQSYEAEMLTEDENIVMVRMSVQYNIGNVKDYLLRVVDPDASLDQATRSALRHVVGSSEMHNVLTEGREALAVDVRDRIQQYMIRYSTGILVTQVNIDETAPPDAVKEAFDDVIKAREDEVRVRNEADAYSNQVVPAARGEAQRMLEEASAYKSRVISQAQGESTRFSKLLAEYKLAPEVTRERLYLDALEDVMTNSSKVMIDVEQGSNLLYLPLDKIMQAAATLPTVREQQAITSPAGGTGSEQPASRRERR